MITITTEEFKNNFEKYHQLGQLEEIIVTSKGKPIYVIIPIQIKKIREMESIFGVLPKNANYQK